MHPGLSIFPFLLTIESYLFFSFVLEKQLF